MRVLQLISSGGVYGAEKMLISLVKALGERACESVIGVFDNLHVGCVGVLEEEATANGVQVNAIPCRGRVDFRAAARIVDLITKHEIDLVHTHGYKADLYGYVAAKRCHKPIVATSHYWTRRTVPLRLYAYLDQIVLRRFDGVVGVSDEISESIVKTHTPAERVITIDNGIDLTPFRNAVPSLSGFRKNNGAIVGAVGRLAVQKGFDYLLRAVPGILKQFPDTVFLIVGEGNEREKLESLTRELQITQSVRFLGQRSDMPNVYASFDIFVLSSLDEGMPIAILEALASGTPTVATRVAAVPKLIINQKTGILVEAGDANALEHAVVSLLEDANRRSALGKHGRDWVEQNYSAGTMAENYLKLYRRVSRGEPLVATAMCEGHS